MDNHKVMQKKINLLEKEVQKLKLQLEDKDKTINVLRTENRRLRNRKMKKLCAAEKELKKRHYQEEDMEDLLDILEEEIIEAKKQSKIINRKEKEEEKTYLFIPDMNGNIRKFKKQ